MPSVGSLKRRFENIALPEPPSPEKQRVPLKRYSMPLRQSTLNFGGTPAQTRGTMKSESSTSLALPTPPVEDIDNKTLDVDIPDSRLRLSLPTPSESATDASSTGSMTPKAKGPVKSRSKRVTSTRKGNRPSKETPEPSPAGNEKQRNISGDTLVAGSANMSQSSLVKGSVDALNLDWNMSVHFADQKEPQVAEEEVEGDSSETSSTITVAVDESNTEPQIKHALDDEHEDDHVEAQEQKRAAKRVKIADKQNKWEQRRKRAEKNSTRRSSRASLLVNKASEVVSAVTSSVLGKRKNKDHDHPAPAQEKLEPDVKKPRLTTIEEKPLQGDEGTLAAANRAMKSRAPKDKKFLISGLYAGQTRTFDQTKPGAKNKTELSASHENNVLPLPMYAGSRLLDSGRDFKLPFDVFSPLPAGQPKPDEWKKVNRNVFVGDAADFWRDAKFTEHSTCMCKPATGCDPDICMNKFMYYECDEKNCNLTAEQCGNRAFEGLRKRVKKGGKYDVGVEVMRTNDRGYGVRANRTFEPNQIIVEYTGEIITQEECERRMHTMYKENECYYLMAFDQNMIIDATRGSLARFINHSCSPNCRMEKWTVGGKPRMALFAGDMGIMTGEELTYDYNFDPYSQKNVQVCRCGSANCRGVLGPKPKDLPKKEEGGFLAGMKRKLEEVLESESARKKKQQKKNDEKPKLPRGWAYIEPDPSTTKGGKKAVIPEPVKKNINDVDPEKILRKSSDGKLNRQPSKLKRALSRGNGKIGGGKGGSIRAKKSTVSTIQIHKKGKKTTAKMVKMSGKKGEKRVVSTSSQRRLIDNDQEVNNNEDETNMQEVDEQQQQDEDEENHQEMEYEDDEAVRPVSALNRRSNSLREKAHEFIRDKVGKSLKGR